MYLNRGFIGGLILAVIPWIIFKLYNTELMLYRVPYITRDYEVSELKQKYRVGLRLMFPITVALCCVITYPVFMGYNFFSRIYQYKLGILHFAMFPDKLYWFLPAFSTGILASGIISMVLYELYYRERFDEFLVYYYVTLGCRSFDDIIKNMSLAILIYKIIGAITSFLIIAFVVLGFNWYTIFNDKGVYINSYFNFRQKYYSYTEVKELKKVEKVKVPSGNIISNLHVVIVFDDGSIWSSYNSIEEKEDKYEIELLKFLEMKTMKQIIETEF